MNSKALGIIFSFFSLAFFAQDVQLTQVYSAPLYLNPAFTGSSGCTRFNLQSRNQWVGVNKAYKSNLFAVDHTFNTKNVSAGLLIMSDEAGSGNLKTINISPSLTYQLKLNRFYSLRFGVQPGVGIKTINFNKLLFGDQIYRGDKLGTELTSVEQVPLNKTYLDLNAGITLTNQNFWFGVAASHLNKPNNSFYNNAKAIIPIKYSAHAGIKLQINRDEKFAPHKKYISPIVHYKRQNEFDQVDIGMYYSQNLIQAGIWYRGIPVLKYYKPGYKNNDALAFIIGLSAEKFNVGYSYDFTISALTMRTKGSHEISLTYQICHKNKKPVYRLVHCPKF